MSAFARRDQREVGPIGKPVESIPDAGSRPTPFDRRDALAVAAAFILGLGLRLFSPNPESVWLDEANSVLIAAQPLPDLVSALTRDGNPPLYYILLHYWAKLFGEGEVALRTLSAILGALLAPGLYLVARRGFGRAAAVVAAILAIAWPLHVYYSQQIRMYSLLPVLALAFVAALLRALERGDASTWRDWALVVVSALAVVWTHNYGMFLVAAAPVAWLLRGPRTKRTATRLAIAIATIGVIDLLWLPIVLRQASSGVGWWIPHFFRIEGALAPVHSLLLFGAGYDYPLYLQALSGPKSTSAIAIGWFVVVGVGGVVLALTTRSTRSHGLVLVALAFVPILLPFVASLVSTPIYLVARYDMVAYPAFALLIGAGAEAGWRRSRLAQFAILVAMATYGGLAASTLRQYWAVKPALVEQAMGNVIAAHAAEGDVVLTTGLARAPLEYYLRRMGWSERLRIESFPRVIAEHLGWFDPSETSAEEREREARDVIAALTGFAGTVFFAGHGDYGNELRAELEERATRQDELFATVSYGVIAYRLGR